jgi:hypothetical protein
MKKKRWKIFLRPNIVKQFNQSSALVQELTLKAFLQLQKNPVCGKNIEKLVDGKWIKVELIEIKEDK